MLKMGGYEGRGIGRVSHYMKSEQIPEVHGRSDYRKNEIKGEVHLFGPFWIGQFP